MNSSRDSSSTKQTLRTVSTGTVLRLFRYPFVLLSMAIIPRMMGDVNYGKYALFLSIYGIMEFFVDIGITQVMGRFIPPLEAEGLKDKSIHVFHGILLYSMLFTTCVMLIALTGKTLLFPDIPKFWIAMMCCILLLSQFEGVLFAYIYGLNRIALFSTKEIMRSAFTFLCVLAGYWLYGLRGAFAGLVANELLLSAVAIIFTRNRLFKRSASLRFHNFSRYIFFGFRCYLPILIYGAMLRSGNVFVNWLTGSSSQVAFFDIANQFLVLCGTFFALVISSLLPSLSALYHHGDEKRVDKFHQTTLQLSTVFCVFAVLTLIWIGRPVIALLLGPSYLPVHRNAVALSPSVFSFVLIWIGVNYTILYKSPRIYAIGMALGFAAMASSFMLLIPPLQSLGGALSALIGFTTSAIFFVIYYHKHFAFVLSGIWKVLLAGIPFCVLYLVPSLRQIAWLIYPASIVIFLLMLLKMEVLSKDKLIFLLNAFKRDAGS